MQKRPKKEGGGEEEGSLRMCYKVYGMRIRSCMLKEKKKVAAPRRMQDDADVRFTFPQRFIGMLSSVSRAAVSRARKRVHITARAGDVGNSDLVLPPNSVAVVSLNFLLLLRARIGAEFASCTPTVLCERWLITLKTCSLSRGLFFSIRSLRATFADVKTERYGLRVFLWNTHRSP